MNLTLGLLNIYDKFDIFAKELILTLSPFQGDYIIIIPRLSCKGAVQMVLKYHMSNSTSRLQEQIYYYPHI